MNLYESIKSNLQESEISLNMDTTFINDKNKKVKIINRIYRDVNNPDVSDTNPYIVFDVSSLEDDKEPKVEYVKNNKMLKSDFIEMLKEENLKKVRTREEVLEEDFGYDKIISTTNLGDETEYTISTSGDINTVRVDDKGNITIK